MPTTNEITLLSYSEMESESFERCERHPDGQFMCYLSVPILKEVSIELLLTVMLIFLLYLTDVCMQFIVRYVKLDKLAFSLNLMH